MRQRIGGRMSLSSLYGNLLSQPAGSGEPDFMGERIDELMNDVSMREGHAPYRMFSRTDTPTTTCKTGAHNLLFPEPYATPIEGLSQ